MDSFNPTTKAQQVISAAAQAAALAGNPDVGPTHLLGALLAQGDGIAAPLLAAVGADAAAVRAELEQRGKGRPTFALAAGDGNIYYLSLLRDVSLDEVPSLKGPEVLRTLDVTLLHALMIEGILGIDRAAQEKQTNLRYVKDTGAALALVRDPAVQAVFLMNPTPVAHVKAVADAGEVMPQKSTFFYPKLASGLVINPIVPSEEV
jgi:hypothetical protein